MNATITYKIDRRLNPFSIEDHKNYVWCIVKVVHPQLGNDTEEPIAIFNLDSEAETFMGQVMVNNLDKKFISIADSVRSKFNEKIKSF